MPCPLTIMFLLMGFSHVERVEHMSPLGRVLAGLLGEKLSLAAQKSAAMQSITRETAKIERAGVNGAANIVVAAGMEVQKDVLNLWSKLKGSLSSSADESTQQQQQLSGAALKQDDTRNSPRK